MNCFCFPAKFYKPGLRHLHLLQHPCLSSSRHNRAWSYKHSMTFQAWCPKAILKSSQNSTGRSVTALWLGSYCYDKDRDLKQLGKERGLFHFTVAVHNGWKTDRAATPGSKESRGQGEALPTSLLPAVLLSLSSDTTQEDVPRGSTIHSDLSSSRAQSSIKKIPPLTYELTIWWRFISQWRFCLPS